MFCDNIQFPVTFAWQCIKSAQFFHSLRLCLYYYFNLFCTEFLYVSEEDSVVLKRQK
jgi:hypothetical protein